MERRALLISLGLSVLAMYLVWQYITSEDKKLEEQYGKATSVPMVIAARDILQFETIRPTDIETVTVPYAMIPPGVIGNPKDVIDAVAAIPMTKGEQILDNKIISRNIYSGLDTQVGLGKRAISIPAGLKSSLDHQIRPGSRVDLAAHFEYKSAGSNINEIKVFMQDILVLATGRTIQSNPPKGVDQNLLKGMMSSFADLKDPKEAQEMLNFAKSDPRYGTITLEVTASQAQIIVYVMTVFPDSITLLLRHSDDRQLNRKGTTNLVDVMGPDSYMVRGKKLPAPRAVPRFKFFDLQGGDQVGIRE